LYDNWISCLTYAPCGFLLIPEKNSVIPEPENLEETCSLDKLLGGNDDNRAACEQACEAAKCCVERNDDEAGMDNCFLEDPLGCAEYAICGRLVLTGGSVPRADPDLETICNWSTITDEASEQACIEACKPGECCVESNIDTDGIDNCLVDGNVLACAEYWPCLILYAVGGQDVDSPPDELATVCSETSIADNPQPCRDLCEEGAGCCFAVGEENCLIGHVDTCAEWTLGGCWRLAFVEEE
jgi:hypothetical protein